MSIMLTPSYKIEIFSQIFRIWVSHQKFVLDLPNSFLPIIEKNGLPLDKELIEEIQIFLEDNLRQSNTEVSRIDLDSYIKRIPLLKCNVNGCWIEINLMEDD